MFSFPWFCNLDIHISSLVLFCPNVIIVQKALYGDIDTHQTHVLPQAESYLHRFGPGMICYWFGHAPLSQLENVNGDLAIVGWKLPEIILWPDG